MEDVSEPIVDAPDVVVERETVPDDASSATLVDEGPAPLSGGSTIAAVEPPGQRGEVPPSGAAMVEPPDSVAPLVPRTLPSMTRTAGRVVLLGSPSQELSANPFLASTPPCLRDAADEATVSGIDTTRTIHHELDSTASAGAPGAAAKEDESRREDAPLNITDVDTFLSLAEPELLSGSPSDADDQGDRPKMETGTQSALAEHGVLPLERSQEHGALPDAHLSASSDALVHADALPPDHSDAAEDSGSPGGEKTWAASLYGTTLDYTSFTGGLLGGVANNTIGILGTGANRIVGSFSPLQLQCWFIFLDFF